MTDLELYLDDIGRPTQNNNKIDKRQIQTDYDILSSEMERNERTRKKGVWMTTIFGSIVTDMRWMQQAGRGENRMRSERKV